MQTTTNSQKLSWIKPTMIEVLQHLTKRDIQRHKIEKLGWEDGLVVSSTSQPSKGHEFDPRPSEKTEQVHTAIAT